MPEQTGGAVAKLIIRSDRIVLYVLLVPTMLIVSYWIGGFIGFLVGIATALAIWLVYVAVKTTVIIVSALCLGRLAFDQELRAICDDASVTGDNASAAARIEDLITREGEDFERLIAFASYLADSGQIKRASEAIEKAAEFVAPHQRWQLFKR